MFLQDHIQKDILSILKVKNYALEEELNRFYRFKTSINIINSGQKVTNSNVKMTRACYLS